MPGPQISIIVPAFNAGSTLERCLSSISGQDYQNLEAVVVDDGSTDDTLQIAHSFETDDPRFKVVTQSNQGVSSARNLALGIASGEIAVFVDSDDYLTAGAASSFAKSFDADTDLVIGSHKTFRDLFGHPAFERTIRRESRTYSAGDGQIDLQDFDVYLNTPWAKAYSLPKIREHGLVFDDVPLGEDHRFNLRYAALCQGDVKVIPDIVYHYRMGGFASAVRCYYNIDELYLGLWEAYREVLFSGSRLAAPADFINKVGKDLMDSCVLHYAVRASRVACEPLSIRAIEEFLSSGVDADDVQDAPSYCESLITTNRRDVVLRRCVRNMRLACDGIKKAVR
jgi:glycosyltransferase involved in cell wall biosynthesis